MTYAERSTVPCAYCYEPVRGNYVWHRSWCTRGIEAEERMKSEISDMITRDVARRAERIRRERHDNRPGKHRPERTGTTP